MEKFSEKQPEQASFMRRAIELARKGEGWTSPNPLVGAVIVKDSKIIGEGYHHLYGGLHAEREALADCQKRGNDARGADIYVTLEPCAHFGKQPPCSHALVEAGLKRVFVGSRDPNPLVSGKGNAYLRENGIEVVEDFLRSECDSLNPVFFHYITNNLPYVVLKYAMTADGKIATVSGKSKWISGEESRAFVQTLRNRYSAILCGIGTVLADDPMLNCRLPGGKNPLRIVLDSGLKIPLESRLVTSAKEIPLVIAAVNPQSKWQKAEESRQKGVWADSSESISFSHSVMEEFSSKKEALEKAGAKVLLLSADSGGKPSLQELLREVALMKIDSILVEGGGEVNYSFLKENLVNYIYAFISPKIFGGSAAKSPVSGAGVLEVEEAFNFEIENVRNFGKDLLLEMKKCLQE